MLSVVFKREPLSVLSLLARNTFLVSKVKYQRLYFSSFWKVEKTPSKRETHCCSGLFAVSTCPLLSLLLINFLSPTCHWALGPDCILLVFEHAEFLTTLRVKPQFILFAFTCAPFSSDDLCLTQSGINFTRKFAFPAIIQYRFSESLWPFPASCMGHQGSKMLGWVYQPIAGHVHTWDTNAAGCLRGYRPITVQEHAWGINTRGLPGGNTNPSCMEHQCNRTLVGVPALGV